MNVPLLNPFESAIPEVIAYSLPSNGPVKCAFNRRGNYLAVGSADGKLEIWDLETRNLRRSMTGHVSRITSISWSRDGRHLLTASLDWNCVYWDLARGKPLCTVRFTSPVNMAQMNPRNNVSFIACPTGQLPAYVVLERQGASSLLVPKITRIVLGGSDETPVSIFEVTYVATFDHRAEHVAFGSSKGAVTILEYPSWKILHNERVAGTNGIRNISYNRRGTDLCVNSADKVIRVCPVENGVPNWDEQVRFKDDIDRGQWTQCCLTPDGDYVIGGNPAKHQIFFWYRVPDPETEIVRLVNKLDGNYAAGGLIDFDLHPYRPMIASVAKQDKVLIWDTNPPENWSAFRPDFTVLNENKEYQEREDEFDWIPTDEIARRKAARAEAAEEDVDVVTIERVAPQNVAYDSDEDDLFEAYLPMT